MQGRKWQGTQFQKQFKKQKADLYGSAFYSNIFLKTKIEFNQLLKSGHFVGPDGSRLFKSSRGACPKNECRFSNQDKC